MTEAGSTLPPAPEMRWALVPHPAFPPATALAVSVAVALSDAALTLRYEIAGATGYVRWPRRAAPARTDGLWKTTCFEAFVGDPRAGYAEFNFAPSGQWAAYAFDSYRAGMRPAPAEPVIESAASSLTARLDPAVLLGRGGARLGLSAVVEEIGGTRSYWALAHASGPPDFHHADCFVLELPAPTRA